MGNFRFKQFEIEQDRCAMKVGTDGVLLGAWAQGGRRILDIGSGTGLISLMMAQRFPEAEVVGIDMDADACGQARENVMASPFRDRVEIECCRLQDFGGTSEAAEALETAEDLKSAGVFDALQIDFSPLEVGRGQRRKNQSGKEKRSAGRPKKKATGPGIFRETVRPAKEHARSRKSAGHHSRPAGKARSARTRNSYPSVRSSEVEDIVRAIFGGGEK